MQCTASTNLSRVLHSICPLLTCGTELTETEAAAGAELEAAAALSALSFVANLATSFFS